MTTIPLPNDPPAIPADFSQRAMSVMVQVRELGRMVDGFRFAPKGRRARIGTVASLPEEFLHLAAAALDVNPALGVSSQITATEVREALSFKREFTNSAKETHLVAKGMEDTIAERLADVGERCLRFYNAAKRANGRDATASLVPHLEAMQRALGKGRRPRKLKKPAAVVPLTKGETR